METSRQQGRSRIAVLFALIHCGVVGGGLVAQDWGPTRVGVTEAREASVQALVHLTGSIEARTYAVVASSVAGVVAELRGREGDLVKRGVTLARLRHDTADRDLLAAQAQLAEAQARLELAQRALDRSLDLRDSGVISQERFDDAGTEVGAWQGRADQAKALISRLENDIERSVVRAPFTGVVVREHCELGEWVAVGGAVVEMVDPSRLVVVVSVPERHFASAREGLVARVGIDSLPELDVEGVIAAVIPLADSQTRTFPVKIEIDNPDNTIGVGMSATVAFPGSEARQATVVPKDAVVSQGPLRLVYRIEDGPAGEDGAPSKIANGVPVVLGAGVGEWIEVKGVAPGDSIVTRGNERLAPGSPVLVETTEYAEP